MKKNIIVCPECNSLLAGKNILKCSRCSFKGKFSDGVYHFIDKNYYWGEISPKEMNEVLQNAEKLGWDQAVQRLIINYPKMEEYLFNHGRLDWLFHCLSLQKNKTCLDIGSGWGSLAFDLVNYFDEVYSLEAVEERIKFQEIRKNQEHMHNLHLVRANFQKLPFADNALDLVAVNGVLEWVGINNYQKSPEVLQKEFLREIYRVLKPGGCIYVGIENRFGLHYLLGATDHSGLPFTSLLPRPLADLAINYFRKTHGHYNLDVRMEDEWPNYRTYTYSLAGYINLLTDSGFDLINPYWTLFYSNPKFSGPVDGINFRYFLDYIASHSPKHSSVGSIFASLGGYIPTCILGLIVKYFAPSFLLYGYKGRPSQLLENKIIDKGKKHSYLKMGGSGSASAKITYFSLDEHGVYKIQKLARFPQYTNNFNNEEQLASKFGGVSSINKKDIGGLKIFSEEVIYGRPVEVGKAKERETAIDWLLQFQDKTRTKQALSRYLAQTSKSLQAYVATLPLTKVEIDRICANLIELVSKMKSSKCMLSSAHGDFCSANILVDSNIRLTVIDWEDYQEKESPLADLAFWVVQSLVEKDGLENLMGNLHQTGTYSKLVTKITEKFIDRYDIDYQTFLLTIPWMAAEKSLRNSKADSGHLGYGSYYLKILKMWANWQ